MKQTTVVQNPEIARRRALAERLMANSELGQQQMIGGHLVQRTPMELLAKAVSGGVGAYQAGAANRMEQEEQQNRQRIMAEALQKFGTDPDAAIGMLAQDPNNMGTALEFQFNRQQAEAEARQAREQAMFNNELAMQRQQAMFGNQMQLQQMRGQNALEVAAMRAQQAAQAAEQKANAPRKLSAQENKAFFEAREQANAANRSLATLQQVQDLAKGGNMFSGSLAGTALTLNRIPVLGSLVDDQTAANTTAYDNLLKELAYSRLSQTFPGAITNAEREALEKLQAVSSYTPAEQKLIIEQSKNALTRLQAMSAAQAQEIASGNVFSNAAQGMLGAMPPSPLDPQEGDMAQNPETGEVMVFTNGEWVLQ